MGPAGSGIAKTVRGGTYGGVGGLGVYAGSGFTIVTNSPGNYTITFPPGTPPVQGFWSLTLYNEHHFFHPNDLKRYSLGTKNKDLHYAADGSLTLTASATPPDNEDLQRN